MEDGINEFDKKKTAENTQICVGYIFEYFNNYLKTAEADERTALHNQKVEKYRNHIKEYSDDIQNWLLNLYSSHHKFVHVYLRKNITDRYFLLYDTEAEFRTLSYEIYSKAVKTLHFLEGESEMIYRFVKDEYRIHSEVPEGVEFHHITAEIDNWLIDTYRTRNVNLYAFCRTYITEFLWNVKLWPREHKKKSKYYNDRETYMSGSYATIDDRMFWNYDYKQKENLFAIDDLYRRMPKKTFTNGKKQFFETVLLYCYILNCDDSDEEYWQEYLEMVYGETTS